jgi:hypothetical protein
VLSASIQQMLTVAFDDARLCETRQANSITISAFPVPQTLHVFIILNVGKRKYQ